MLLRGLRCSGATINSSPGRGDEVSEALLRAACGMQAFLPLLMLFLSQLAVRKQSEKLESWQRLSFGKHHVWFWGPIIPQFFGFQNLP